MFDAGSWNEPIVISDDEDEAYVERELELEQRLSSPRGHFVSQLDDWRYDDEDEQAQEQRLWDEPRFDYEDAPDEDILYGFGAPVSAGSKRKRTVGDASFSSSPRPPPGLPIPSGDPFPSSPKKEAKNKKKRRKREEAERFRLAGLHPTPQSGLPSARQAGPSPMSRPTPHPPHFATATVHSSFSSIPFSQPTAFPLPLKPVFVTPHLSPPLPPPIPSNQLPYNVSLSPTVPLSMVHFNHPKLSYPRSPPMSAPAPAILPIPPTRPQPQPKGIIGRPSAEDLNDQHGSYPVPPQLPLPDPARTLIMDPLPKKYRNDGFVRWWATQFGLQRQRPLRIELHNGKALIEFATPDIAVTAFRSPRIYGEGKEHVRVWWYKVDRELEEGEIDEDGDFHPKSSIHPAKLHSDSTQKTFQQAHKAPLASMSRPPLSLAMPRPFTPPAKDSLPHPLVLVPPSRGVKPQPSSISLSSPTVQSSSVLDDRATSMDIDSDDDDPVMRSLRAAGELLDKVHGEFDTFISSMRLPASASQSTQVADRAGTRGIASIPTDAEKTDVYAPSPTSTEASTVVASASTAGQSPSPTLGSTKTTPTPPPAETRVAKEFTKRDDVLGKLLARKRELEEEIQGKLDARTSRTAETVSIVIPPTSPAVSTAKEDDLRKLVLESKKTRAVGIRPINTRIVARHAGQEHAAVIEQPLSSSGVNLSDLAVNFIAESIKTVSPLLPNAPSPPQVKLPSPEPPPIPEPIALPLPMPQNVSKPSTAKAEETARLQKLQQEIALCKGLMSKMEAAKKEAASQTERDRLLREMRSRRENKSVLWAMSSNGSSRKPAPRIIWPSTTTLILEISDDEGDEDE